MTKTKYRPMWGRIALIIAACFVVGYGIGKLVALL
jgi:hypothetical protein